ncbi:OmpA family protein [Acetobacteraceae bacterium KSS8]|uniref:OmpA family protein n=1 Tax=Endosaccharibacter trunci TaxID=2812733 RepID=A0ABT1W3U5_9PROT|nr:OmpA family protein [Acetobacteraceae bacterium KSS8]
MSRRFPAGRWLAPAALSLLSACAQTQWQESAPGSAQTLATADQMMDLELSDRIARLSRLAQQQSVVPPRIEQTVLPAAEVPGADRPIPVIRITFDERDMFASGSAEPQPGARAMLAVIAENLKHDVPDVHVLVMGHTDSQGTAAGNEALSRARALAVVKLLVAAGANPAQLDAVAIGAAQPIASNATSAGRAANRRVEFVISPSPQANLALVSMRHVDPSFLAGSTGTTRRRVAVLRARFTGPADFAEAPNATAPKVTLADSGPPLVVGDDVTGSPVMQPVATASFHATP